MTLADRLILCRGLVPDLSCRSLSALAGLSHSVVARLERGDGQRPEADTIARLARALGTSSEWLLCGTGQRPTERAIRQAVARARAQREAA
jgi:transcriptional regulator with XRE-family HTH domain